MGSNTLLDLTPWDRPPLNGCRRCGQDFAGLRYFDRHRVGKHEYLWSPEREDGRRCLDAEEMKELGWTLNDAGRWFDPVAAKEVRRAFADVTGTPQTASEPSSGGFPTPETSTGEAA